MNRRVIYCHGLPGSPEELSAFEAPRAHVQGLDRLALCVHDYETDLLSAVDALSIEAPVTLAGFSLGAMSAAYIAAKRSHLVDKLILIAPAAPLELGDFLSDMAGRPVFEAAQKGSATLRAFTAVQACLVAIAPQLALRTMFRRSPEKDTRLLTSRRFACVVTAGMRTCLGRRQAAYRRELLAYVRPWAEVLSEIRCSTEIWSGAADDWAPPAMAQAFKDRLGDLATLNVCAGLGHYTTLQAALPRLQ